MQVCFYFSLILCFCYFDEQKKKTIYFRGRPAHLPTDDSDEEDEEDDEEMDFEGVEDEPSVIVQLSTRVQDGTRCRSGSLDMCIQGKCQVGLLKLCLMDVFFFFK